jgi:hypothetical protein
MTRTAIAFLSSLVLVAGCGDDGETGGTGGGAGTGGAATATTTTDAASTASTSAGVGGGGGEGALEVASTIISESDQSDHEREAQIAVTGAGRVVVAWMDVNPDPEDYFHIAYRVSDDRGATWGDITSIALPEDNNVGANNTLAVGPGGEVWLCWASQLRTPTDRENQRVFVARLGADEGSFGEPIQVTDPEIVVGVYDQPAITVTEEGHLVVSVGQASPSLSAVWASMHRSEDGGQTWERTIPSQEEAPGTYQNLIHPCRAAGSDRIYLFYVDEEIGLALWRSEDAGRTWPTDQRAQVHELGELNQISTGLEGNCVARGDEVWAVYGKSHDDAGSGDTLPTVYDLRLAHSSDGGETFDRWTSIGDAAVGPTYELPHIAVAEDGTLAVTYVAGEGDGDEAASFRLARSTDGGVTFAPSIPVLDPVTLELTRSSAATFGDYSGLQFEGEVLYGAMTDNASGEGHIAFFTAR